MAPIPVTDAIFLLQEGRSQPMHVGGLQLFTPPKGSPPDFLANLYRESLTYTDVNPLFQRTARRTAKDGFQWGWSKDPNIDLEYHVRHSSLPRPGRIRELLSLVSRLHGTLLDRNRPLWEAHLIEGLADGRFAVYTKVHHALVDGVSAMRLMESSLSTSSRKRNMPPPWSQPYEERPSAGITPPDVGELISVASDAIGMVFGTGKALVQSIERGLREQSAALPFQAPSTPLNQPVTGGRRFAADSWSLERMKRVAKASDGTLNDVVMAMCSGALRSYLDDLGQLPDKGLVAMVPVSLHTADSGTGNAVGTILCNLATEVADPAERYKRIQESMAAGKQQFSGLAPEQIIALSSLTMGGLALAPLYRFGAMRPPFNIVISNVPGPRKALYWNGARLDENYPVSIVMDGQALNITITSYMDNVEFGLIGCRRTLPRLQKMLTELEQSLDDLETALGI